MYRPTLYEISPALDEYLRDAKLAEAKLAREANRARKQARSETRGLRLFGLRLAPAA